MNCPYCQTTEMYCRDGRWRCPRCHDRETNMPANRVSASDSHAALVEEIARLRSITVELLAAAGAAEKLIGWLREMTIQGQITVTSYGERLKPSDYDAVTGLRTAIARAKGEA